MNVLKLFIALSLLVASFNVSANSETTIQNEKTEATIIKGKTVKFKLLNNSNKSIKLRIPGVMNPNLSPNSSSSVSLQVGQEIFFYIKRKKHLLLVVDKSYNKKNVQVDSLIKQRKAKMKLKRN